MKTLALVALGFLFGLAVFSSSPRPPLRRPLVFADADRDDDSAPWAGAL